MLSKLELFTEACSQLDKRGVVVQNELCLHTRHQASSCLRCPTACPTGAIRFEDGLVFTADKCTGCGACTTVCPSGALSGKLPSNAEVRALVQRHIAQSGAVAFACESWLEQHPEERDRVVALQCTARLDESLLAEAVLSGARSVTLIDGACAECPQGKLRELAQQTATTVNTLLARWQHKPAVVLQPELPAEIVALPQTQEAATGLSRRGFFTVFRGRGAELATEALPGVLSVALGRRTENPNAHRLLSEYPKHRPERHQRLVALLKQQPGKPEPAAFESEMWGEVTATHGCSGCGGCAEICPTGALTAVEHDNLWGIFFEGSRCTHCGLCVNMCSRESLQLSSTIQLDTMLKQEPRLLTVKSQEEVGSLMEPMEARIARLFDGYVTW